MPAFDVKRFLWGLAVVAIGGLLWADNLGLVELSFKFSRDWPILLVGLGLLYVKSAFVSARGGLRGRARAAGVSDILWELEKGGISAEEALRRLRG